MSSLYPNRLPENMSGMKITDTAHLLNSVSPTALLRADGWIKAGEQIDNTLQKFEAVMGGMDELGPGGTTPNFVMDNSDVGPKLPKDLIKEGLDEMKGGTWPQK